MKERKSLIQWIKEHKKELIIAGVSVSTLVLIVLGIKNRETIMAVWESLKVAVEKPSKKVSEEVTRNIVKVPPVQTPEIILPSDDPRLPFEVSRHIRNLPEGWHASPEKIATALANNIDLMDGQTWVDNYMKGGAVA